MNARKLITELPICLGLIVGSKLGFSASALAQTCTPLEIVNGKGSTLTKKVSPPPTGITRSNWNTDFAIPGGQAFNNYVVTVVSEEDTKYNIEMYLKYSDDTTDQFYNNTVELKAGVPLKITASPRLRVEPFQVNLKVGGLDAIGESYTATVVGCR